MAAFVFRLSMILGTAASLCASGCVYRNGISTCRFWADHNTLMMPALYLEETDHLPYHAPRVEHYQWMYNAHTVAQRHSGGVYPAGGHSETKRPTPSHHEPAVPAPSEFQPEEPTAPDDRLPPLPSTLPQELKSLEDGPVPSIPLPISPKTERDERDGPTAWGFGPFRGGRQ